MPPPLQPPLYSTRLQFRSNDIIHTADVVYLDSSTSSPSRGTVVALHGSPGSHDDFKYITPLLLERGFRVIAPNFPGFGFSEDLPQLRHINDERNAFIQAFITHVRLTGPVLFLGHSRGSENALMMSVQDENSIGAVMVNPPGLRAHRALRPFKMFTDFVESYEATSDASEQAELEQLILDHQGTANLSFGTGRIAANSVRAMRYSELGGQREWLQRIRRLPSQRLLLMYGGADYLIETEISRELAAAVEGHFKIKVETSDRSEEMVACMEIDRGFIDEKKKAIVAEFVPDGHFIQKHRAEFIVHGIDVMFTVAEEICSKL